MHLLLIRSRIVWTHIGETLDMDIKGSACWSPSPYKYKYKYALALAFRHATGHACIVYWPLLLVEISGAHLTLDYLFFC